jgi:Flp pilus assembly protein TadG
MLPSRRRSTARRDERGGVTLIVALLLVPMLLLIAFTLDLGMAYAQAQAFAAGSDSAALAIAGAKRANLNAHPSAPGNCQSLVDTDAGQALAIAKKQADANRPYDLKATTGQVDVHVALTCVDATGAPDANGVLRVRVTVQRDVPTTLGKLAGVDSIKASRQATAGLGVSGVVKGGAFPLTICDEQAKAIMSRAISSPYPTEVIDVDKVWKADCSSKNGSGNWGWLDCGGNGIPTLVDAILNGCDIDLTLSGSPPTITVDGTPGNRINAGPVGSALDSVKGQVIALPVYDKITGTGANTQYRIVGFINLKFIDYDKRSGNITVQYVSYSPVGSITPGCGIGGTGCATFNNYGIGLGS